MKEYETREVEMNNKKKKDTWDTDAGEREDEYGSRERIS